MVQRPFSSFCRGLAPVMNSPESVTSVALGASSRKVTRRSGATSGERTVDACAQALVAPTIASRAVFIVAVYIPWNPAESRYIQQMRCILASFLAAIPLFAQPPRPARDANQPIDAEYSKKIQEYTTEKFFNSP